MTKKDFLKSYLEAEARIALKKGQIKQFGHADSIAAELAALEKQRSDVLLAINAVPNPVQRTLLEARYISGMRWRDVARVIGYSERQMFNIAKQAQEQITVGRDYV